MMCVCVSQRQCVFSHYRQWLGGQSVFTDGVMATAAQTAEVCSCGVPVTESYRDRIVWRQSESTIED